MRKILLGCVLLLPMAALARDDCAVSKSYDLAPDMSGIETVVFEIGNFDLDLRGAAGATARLRGRACASEADQLAQLRTRRDGDRLLVSLQSEDDDGWNFNWFGNNYSSRMTLSATLPDDVDVEVHLGSGDASVSGVAQLDLSVGSGDADIRAVPGAVTLDVGSGDITARDIGPLRVDSVGSGDIAASDIAGDVDIGSIGSGDLELRDVDGDVEIGAIGSGDIDADNVTGSLTVRSMGSGDVDHSGIQGRVELPATEH